MDNKEKDKMVDFNKYTAAKVKENDNERATSGEVIRFLNGIVQLEQMELMGFATLLGVPLGTWKEDLSSVKNLSDEELIENMNFRDIGDIAAEMLDSFVVVKQNIRDNVLVLLEAIVGDEEDERTDSVEKGQK